jgi:hypothetical protein
MVSQGHKATKVKLDFLEWKDCLDQREILGTVDYTGQGDLKEIE